MNEVRKSGLRMFGLAWILFLLACSPSTPPSTQSSVAPNPAPAGPKTLRLGMVANYEPSPGLVLFANGGTGYPQHTFLVHAGLTVYDTQENLLPWIATTIPSVNAGDWQVFDDGRMDVTWKLRPCVMWHDGTPLAADDFVFGLQVLEDKSLAAARPASLNLIASAEAPDASTLVIHWKQPYILANTGILTIQPALPRHLIGDLYAQGDPQAFSTSPYFNTQFIGLGPYRLANWASGSEMDLAAFDQYFLGRPKIDRIIIKYYGGVNEVVTALFAQDIDGVTNGILTGGQLTTIRDSWEAQGKGTTAVTTAGTRNYRYVFRDPNYPWTKDVRIRHALIQMLDRQGIVDSLYYGLTTPADVIVGTDDPIYALIQQRGLAGDPFDLTKAQALMADAGWTKGPDGTYHDAAGQPFNIEVRGSDKVDNVAEEQVLTAQWKAAGLNAALMSVPETAVNKNELRASAAGVNGMPIERNAIVYEDFISSQIASADTRWVGANTGAYRNSAYDALYDRYLVALDPAVRQNLTADMEKLLSDDAASINVRYDLGTNIIAFRNGVHGPGPMGPIQQATTWNVQTWDMDS